MEIKNDIKNSKFSADVIGGEAKLLYRRGSDNSYELVSTQVPIEARGKNVADSLVREALKMAKDEKVKVIATCPYVKSWFERHPEERGILKSSAQEPPMEKL